MEQWLDKIDQFRSSIWTKVTDGETVESGRDSESLVTLQLPFDSFRIFSFLDDKGFRTTAPSIGTRRWHGFSESIQKDHSTPDTFQGRSKGADNYVAKWDDMFCVHWFPASK